MNGPIKKSIFFKNYLFRSYICVCFPLVAIVKEHLVIYLAFWLDVAQSFNLLM